MLSKVVDEFLDHPLFFGRGGVRGEVQGKAEAVEDAVVELYQACGAAFAK